MRKTTEPPADGSGPSPSSAIRIPDHVVARRFAHETVLLNVNTARYHGLNPTAGHMLEVLHRSRSMRDAIDALTKEYSRPRAEIERDVNDLCEDLLARGLVEVDDVR